MNLNSEYWLLLVLLGALALGGCDSTPNEGDEVEAAVQRPSRSAIVELVGEPRHNFGEARIMEEFEQRFEVKNTGNEPLELAPLNEQDSTLQGRVEGSPVAPGESGFLILSWTVNEYLDDFMLTTKFKTNDVENAELELAVHGRVKIPVRPAEARILVTDAKASQGFKRSVDILGFVSEDLEILSFEWIKPESAEFLDVEFETLEKGHSAFVEYPEAMSVVRVWVTAKAGMPSGTLLETLTMKSNQQERRPLQVSLLARVRGAFEIQVPEGLPYDGDRNVIDLGRVNRFSEKTEQLSIVAPCDELTVDELELKATTLDPESVLVVTCQPAKRVGQAFVVPVEVTIRGDGKSISRLGPTDDLLGRIVFESNDPSHPSCEVLVKLAVTQ